MFKLRASYGSLGNQTFAYNRDFPYYDSYPYLPILPKGTGGIILGSGRPTIVNSPKPVSDNFTWESIQTVNFGVDLSLLKNRLSLNFDKYTRYTRDMLIPGQELPQFSEQIHPQRITVTLKQRAGSCA
ncbi:TonB-dependent receptor [Niabella sp. W65]|nr:TonB-dependent receptor [Niabella sp. W65]MCH7362899.1 TonB-dependent receptor [Niabella sp. W65]